MRKSIRRIIILFSMVQFIYIYVHAYEGNEIAVTSIHTESAYTTIVVNNSLRISRIQFVCDIDGNDCIKFPEYVNTDKKPVPFITLLNETTEDIIRKALLDKTAVEKATDNATFRISKVQRNPDINSTIKAFITLVFNEGIAVEVRIIQTKDTLGVMWPMIEDPESKKGEQVVEITNSSMRKMVEKMLIKKYMLLSKDWE